MMVKVFNGEIAEYGGNIYNGKTVRYYANRTYREIAIDFGLNISSNMYESEIAELVRTSSDTDDLYADMQQYETLTSVYNEFRTGKRFECTEVEYNDYNGRIEKMTFEEI